MLAGCIIVFVFSSLAGFFGTPYFWAAMKLKKEGRKEIAEWRRQNGHSVVE